MTDLSRSRTAATVAIIVVLVAAVAHAVAAPQQGAAPETAPATEHWKILLGSQDRPRQTLYLSVTPTSDGSGYSATFSNPSRGIVDRPVSDLYYGEIAFKVGAGGGEYRARLAPDGLHAVGAFRIDDRSTPLRMERVSVEDATAAIAAGIDSWRRFALEHSDQIIEALQLGPEMVIADVGAGRGEWAVTLAERMGPTSQVLATEIDPALLTQTRRLMAAVGIDNVTPILGGLSDPGLPDDCCDAILLRLVYHEFSVPESMLAGLLRALRPGGIIAVIENPGEGEHLIDAQQVIDEFTRSGFALVRRVQDWSVERQYCLLFRRPR